SNISNKIPNCKVFSVQDREQRSVDRVWMVYRCCIDGVYIEYQNSIAKEISSFGPKQQGALFI
ncbi:MAG: hypothetical protein J7621_24425, partial [Niastella sp.]|nr:hypothetical protein [Niastella sp.]